MTDKKRLKKIRAEIRKLKETNNEIFAGCRKLEKRNNTLEDEINELKEMQATQKMFNTILHKRYKNYKKSPKLLGQGWDKIMDRT